MSPSLTVLRSFIHNLEEGVVLLDSDRRLIAANRAALELAGAEEEGELPGCLSRSIDEEMWNLAARGVEILNLPLSIRAGGEEKTILLSLLPLEVEAEEGEPAGTAVILKPFVASGLPPADSWFQWGRSYLEQVTDNLREAVCYLDREGRITYTNRAFEEAAGRPFSELAGKPLPSVLRPSSRPLFLMEVLEKMREEGYWDGELDVETPRGRRTLLATITKVEGSGGKDMGAAFLARDITDRKRLEEEMRQKNRELGLIFDLLQLTTGYRDMRETVSGLLSRILSLVRAEAGAVYLKPWGGEDLELYAVQGFNYRSSRALAAPGKGVDLARRAMRSQRGIIVDGEGVQPGEDILGGKRGPLLSLAAVPIGWGGREVGALLVAHKEKGRFDEEKLSVLKSLSSQLGVVFELGGLLEELQGKLEELGRERDFSRALVDAMPSALALLDEKGNVVFVNRRFAELLGYGYREVEGKPFTSLLARGEKRRVGRAVMVRRPGESRWTEAGIVTHAGTKPFLVISTPRPYEGGEYRGAIVILNDLSRQWSVERRVSRMEEEARRLDRELSGARRTLRKLDARSKAYLSMVHHEIAGPIRMLRRRLEEMERGSDGGAGEELKEDLDWLLAEVARLERLTSDIKDIGALEKGRLRLRRSKTDLGELVSRAAEEVKTGKRRSGVKLRLHLPGEPLVARVDRGRMAQVIAGVLDNAVEFSPEEGTVDLRLVRREGTALLEIKDMGPGMEPGLLRSLHELMEGEGPAEGLRTGLSLYLCHHVVRAHGGEFRLESEPGKGTKVRITLPLAAEEEGG